jgi:hypothetical protein
MALRDNAGLPIFFFETEAIFLPRILIRQKRLSNQFTENRTKTITTTPTQGNDTPNKEPQDQKLDRQTHPKH